MPREEDPKILSALRRAFAASEPCVVSFTRTANGQGHRKDEGIAPLLRAMPVPLAGKQAALKSAMVKFIDDGGWVNRKDEDGDVEMGFPPAVYHEFRLLVASVPLYVKVTMQDAETNNPVVIVISVKRDDKARARR